MMFYDVFIINDLRENIFILYMKKNWESCKLKEIKIMNVTNLGKIHYQKQKQIHTKYSWL